MNIYHNYSRLTFNFSISRLCACPIDLEQTDIVINVIKAIPMIKITTKYVYYIFKILWQNNL